jgi:hypothetical protein
MLQRVTEVLDLEELYIKLVPSVIVGREMRSVFFPEFISIL